MTRVATDMTQSAAKAQTIVDGPGDWRASSP